MLNLTSRHEDENEMELQLHAFLSLALVEGHLSTSHPDFKTSGERALITLSIGSWIDLRVGLDAEAKRKASTRIPTPPLGPISSRCNEFFGFYLFFSLPPTKPLQGTGPFLLAMFYNCTVVAEVRLHFLARHHVALCK